jgi:hypothetical protein
MEGWEKNYQPTSNGLWWAISSGARDMVKHILHTSPSLANEQWRDSTPLHEAMLMAYKWNGKNRYLIVKLLLKAGAIVPQDATLFERLYDPVHHQWTSFLTDDWVKQMLQMLIIRGAKPSRQSPDLVDDLFFQYLVVIRALKATRFALVVVLRKRTRLPKDVALFSASCVSIHVTLKMLQ